MYQQTPRMLKYYKVSDTVNAVKNNNSDCILPLEEYKQKQKTQGLHRFFKPKVTNNNQKEENVTVNIVSPPKCINTPKSPVKPIYCELSKVKGIFQKSNTFPKTQNPINSNRGRSVDIGNKTPNNIQLTRANSQQPRDIGNIYIKEEESKIINLQHHDARGSILGMELKSQKVGERRKFRDLEALPEDEDYSLYKNKRNKEITEDNKK